MPRRARVLLPLPLPEAFDYVAHDDFGDLKRGDHVSAPLGPRRVRGVVLGVDDMAGVNRPLKPLVERLADLPCQRARSPSLNGRRGTPVSRRAKRWPWRCAAWPIRLRGHCGWSRRQVSRRRS